MFFSKQRQIHTLIVKHLNTVGTCHKVFCECVEELFSSEPNMEAEHLAEKVEDLESQADANRHDIIRALLKGGLLPESRREILKLIELVDEIANKAEETIKQMVLQKIIFPDVIKEDIKAINHKTMEQFAVLSRAIDALFIDYKELQNDYEQIKRIELMESEIDDIENRTIKKLYALDIDLARKNQLKGIVSQIADISDLIEDISDMLEIILVLRKA